MGKSDFKSPRRRNPLTIARPFSKASSSSAPKANIKVIVRVRPPNAREHDDNQRAVVKLLDDNLLVFDPKIHTQGFFYHGVEQKGRDLLRKANKDMQFVFDKVFGFDSTNEHVFENTTKELIRSLMDGCNCSVFAYGATGSGKTHTMLGHNGNPGITYLTMAELFKAQEELAEERTFELGITYLEVYNELVQDLLNPGPALQLREDGKYGVTVAGNKLHKINNPDELFSLLEKGNSNRTQHPTDANAESSRSHAVFQVYVQMEFRSSREVRTAKLSMIDLAGSERGSATGYGGARFAEGANINKSLLALGNCINSLSDGQKYVPYRDSKLTRLLKDSLGGNCQTVMIANVSPSSFSYEDTYNTLKYATRAKNIKADVRRNVVNLELHAGEYVKIVEQLKKDLERAKAQARVREVEKKVDPAILAQLLKFFEDRKKLLERIFNIESSEQMVILRRHLKEDINSRLSGFLDNTDDKEEAHRRIGNTVDRFHKQEGTFKSELVELKLSKLHLESQTTEFIKAHPEVQQAAELETLKLEKLQAGHENEISQKKFMMSNEEAKSMGCVLEETCKMLQSCYFQLRGHGLASETLIQEYQELINHLQGRKNITWDDGVDSGLSSTASATSLDGEVRPPKRKMDEDANPPSSFNSTFVMEPPKPKLQICAGDVVTKVYKNKKKPEPLRENRLTPRSKHATMKKALLKGNVAAMKRPPFRM